MQAARLGASESQLDMLLAFETSSEFSDAEKAALAWAAAMTSLTARNDDAAFERLRQHFSEAEIVEITAMAGLFNYFNRVAEALHIEPTLPGEGL